MILQSMKICTYIEQQSLESCISLIGIHFLSSCRTLGRQHSKRPSRTRRRWRRRRRQACICLSTKTTSITKYNVHCLCRQKIKKKDLQQSVSCIRTSLASSSHPRQHRSSSFNFSTDVLEFVIQGKQLKILQDLMLIS